MSKRTFLLSVIAVLTTTSSILVGASAGARAAAQLHPARFVTPKCNGGPGVGLTTGTPTFLPWIVNWLNTTGNGFAGGIGYELQFTNITHHACSMEGFPNVTAVNVAGHRIGAPATHSGSAGSIVDVSAGATVKATWLVTDTANIPVATCQPTTAAGIRVSAPFARTSDVIPFPFSVCSAPGTSSMEVGTVTH